MNILHEQLDPEQEEIALASQTSLLVLAGPGAGKTRLLTNVAAYYVRRTPQSHARVLCVTFGVEASNEMRERLRSPALGVRQRQRTYVRNFHQLGSDLLHAYGDRIGLSRSSHIAPDTTDLIEDILGEMGLSTIRPQNVAAAMSGLRNQRNTAEAPVPAETLQAIVDAYDVKKRERELWDYDDLIIRAVELLDADERVKRIVQGMFGYIVVDELQDTSGYQLELLARVSGDGLTPLFGVADDDQMIYGWRDARAENVREFKKRFRTGERSLLGNYRCPPKVVEAANRIIAPNRADGDERVGYSRVAGRTGQVLAMEAQSSTPATVASVVQAELNAGVQPEHIAILSAHKFKFKDLKPSLEARHIPFVQIGDHSLAAAPVSRLFLAALACAERPDDARTRERIASLTATVAPPATEAELDAAVSQLLQPASPEEMLARSMTIAGVDFSSRDVLQIRRIIAVAAKESESYAKPATASSIVINWARIDAKLRREDKSVKLMTTFGAKGLEFDTVVLPYFEAGLVPYAPRGQAIDWAEERRKLFVAVTRARVRVVFVYAGRPSEFLDELQNVVEQWPPWEFEVRATA